MQTKIKKLEAYYLTYPLDEPVRTSFGMMRYRPAVFVRLEDSQGGVGWGEVWCNFPDGGGAHRANLINEVIAPLVQGLELSDPSELQAHLKARTHILMLQSGEYGPFGQCLAACDIASWDLFARYAELPLWRYAGGQSGRIPVYASGINPQGAGATIARAQACGHEMFKVKVGFGHENDLRTLFEAKAIAGDLLMIAADANQAWDLQSACDFVDKADGLDLQWLEEPIRSDSTKQQWVALREHIDGRIPLAGGENLDSLARFEEAIAQNTLQVVQPDIAKWGGFTHCIPLAKSILFSKRRFCPHYLGGGIGLAASAHWLAAVGGEGRLEIDVNKNPLRDNFAGPAAQVQSGAVELGEAPGLGLHIDVQALAEWRVV